MSECDLIDLASISTIQGNGYVVLLNAETPDKEIIAVSSNIIMIGNFNDPALFVGKPVKDCFSGKFGEEIWKFVCQEEEHQFCYVPCINVFLSNPPTFSRHHLLLEIIPDTGINGNEYTRKYTRNLSTISTQKTLQEIFVTACLTVTSMVNYERAMVYQFQEDLSGKVVYEWIDPSLVAILESYQNTFFPASDIPYPARQMYIKKNIRVIFDNDLDDVEVVTLGTSGESMDLSSCLLRSVHPVHRSYMKNMGVRSSLSIGIMVDEDLWGLLVFHSYGSPMSPCAHDMELIQNLGNLVSYQVHKVEQDNYELRKLSLVFTMDKIFEFHVPGTFWKENVAEILKVMKADSMTVKIGDHSDMTWGNTDLNLKNDEYKNISARALNQEWVIEAYDNPPRGVLCIAQEKFKILFVRKSITSDKIWSGDPSHVKVMRPDGVPGPRGSFERYIQSNVDSLNKWDKFDRKLASTVSSVLKLYSIATTRSTGQIQYITEEKREPYLDPTIVSHFSHELLTPIHGISTFLSLLVEDSNLCISDIQEQVKYAQDSLNTVVRLVKSILSMAGGRCIYDEAQTERVNLLQCVLDIEKLYIDNRSFSTRIVGDRKDFEEEVLLKKQFLHTSLCSIIENAISSHQTTDVKLIVSRNSTHREAIMMWNDSTEGFSHRSIRNSEDTSGISDIDNWYTMSVQYLGIGIHEDMLTNVIKYGDKTSTLQTIQNSHEGIGADIYNCMTKIFAMNGSIGIASTIGKCTRISIMVPAKRVEEPVKESQVVLDEGIFIVVDDNLVNRRLASRLVKIAFNKLNLNPKIIDFSNGQICINEIKKLRERNETILGILLDHHMPVMTGKEAAKMIRNNEIVNGFAKIPIFGFTADTTKDIRAEMLNSGMDDVLPKPISMRHLEETCLNILRKYKQ